MPTAALFSNGNFPKHAYFLIYIYFYDFRDLLKKIELDMETNFCMGLNFGYG